MRKSPTAPPRSLVTAVIALAVATVLAACGGADPEETADPGTSPPADATVVEVSAVEFGYSASATQVPAGTVAFELTNDGEMGHDLVLEGGPGGATAVIGSGETATLTVELEPGTYALYCSVSNHRALGMEFEITVT